MENTKTATGIQSRAERSSRTSRFPLHGWAGLALIVTFWTLNWGLEGLRTHWGFFPLWLGYCLLVDGLVYLRRGTSLATRDWRKYIGLFLLSAPIWWIFEWANGRLQNWFYQGAEAFSPAAYTFWATLSFTTVVPAVFGTAELVASFGWFKRLGLHGPAVRPTLPTTLLFFVTGIVAFGLMWAWPRLFFPFLWISVYFIFEPVNVWLGFRTVASSTARRDWRPVLNLWAGVLITAFFWEMWNYFSYPKWIYQIPYANWLPVFEMPLVGYGGYLPFALELYAMYHLVMGLLGDRQGGYVQIEGQAGQG